jgi:hypothetical protein
MSASSDEIAAGINKAVAGIASSILIGLVAGNVFGGLGSNPEWRNANNGCACSAPPFNVSSPILRSLAEATNGRSWRDSFSAFDALLDIGIATLGLLAICHFRRCGLPFVAV